MPEQDFSKNYSAVSVAKNTVYNLLGYGFPLLFAVVIIPSLIKGLGNEKFGILNLAWIVVGYFSFLDFGIGRTLTKFIAEKIGNNHVKDIPDMFWTSFLLMCAFSFLFVIFGVVFTPYLVENILNISPLLQNDVRKTFYLLVLSIPIITTSAGFKGVLEAYQRFRVINIIRVLLGIFTFLGPLLCLLYSKELFFIVLILILVRLIAWLLYLSECFKINPEIRLKIRVKKELFKPVIQLSGWMTVSNLIGPLMLSFDRFLIGAVISASAITYYSTPYEVITKLLLIPGALIGVLFPIFSANYLTNNELSERLYYRGVKFIFLLLFPIVLVITTFSLEILSIWINDNFAYESYLVLKLLSIGVLFNSITYIPFTFLQGIGRPDLTSKIQLYQTPFYIFFMYIAVKQLNINGVALVWSLRVLLDSCIMFWFADKFIITKMVKKEILFLSILSLCVISAYFISGLIVKIVFTLVILSVFVFVSLKYLINDDESRYIKSKLKFL